MTCPAANFAKSSELIEETSLVGFSANRKFEI